ncbi:MAG: flagellar biosynthetic protein FliR [Alphaproteobacteria bacterium]
MFAEWLEGSVFATLLVFIRLGMIFVVMPGLGDQSVPPQIRLLMALGISVMMLPALSGYVPPVPDSPIMLAGLLVHEAMIGLFIGTVARVMLTALSTAGTIIAQQAGLANAFLFNPSLGASGSLPAALLVQSGVLIIFVTDMHLVIIATLAETYIRFPVGQPIESADMADMIARMVSYSFNLGIKLAAPFLVVGMIFFLGLGLLNRLMPQLQVFFIAMPIQIVMGLVMLMLCIAAILQIWFDAFESSMIHFITPPPTP